MQISINPAKWYERLWASLCFFTALPFSKVFKPSSPAFRSVLHFWPLTGWLGSGVACGFIVGCSAVGHLPLMVSVPLALLLRSLLYGGRYKREMAACLSALAQPALSSGKSVQEREVSQMTALRWTILIFYAVALITVLTGLHDAWTAGLALWAADPFCKLLACQLTQMLPHDMEGEQPRYRLIGGRFGIRTGLGLTLQGVIPLLAGCLLSASRLSPHIPSLPLGSLFWELVFVPGLLMYMLYLFIYNRRKAYTWSHCCCAMLLCELAFLTALFLLSR